MDCFYVYLDDNRFVSFGELGNFWYIGVYCFCSWIIVFIFFFKLVIYEYLDSIFDNF